MFLPLIIVCQITNRSRCCEECPQNVLVLHIKLASGFNAQAEVGLESIP